MAGKYYKRPGARCNYGNFDGCNAIQRMFGEATKGAPKQGQGSGSKFKKWIDDLKNELATDWSKNLLEQDLEAVLGSTFKEVSLSTKILLRL